MDFKIALVGLLMVGILAGGAFAYPVELKEPSFITKMLFCQKYNFWLCLGHAGSSTLVQSTVITESVSTTTSTTSSTTTSTIGCIPVRNVYEYEHCLKATMNGCCRR